MTHLPQIDNEWLRTELEKLPKAKSPTQEIHRHHMIDQSIEFPAESKLENRLAYMGMGAGLLFMILSVAVIWAGFYQANLHKSSLENNTGIQHADPTNHSYETLLSQDQEAEFQQWKNLYAPSDSGFDYDLRGAFLAGFKLDYNGHWPDIYKKPNHPTFSSESKYATGSNQIFAGKWAGDTFVPSAIPYSGGN